MKINCIEDIANSNLPLPVVSDIVKRIGDWLAAGGNIEDGYIKQQFRYAENVMKAMEARA